MSALFSLKHIDGAPFLTSLPSHEAERSLGESIRYLDAEPVIIVDLNHVSFSDSVDACRDMLFEMRPDVAIVVINPTHSIRVPPSFDRSCGIIVVDSALAAAVSARRIEHLNRIRRQRGTARRRRFHVRCSIV